MAESRDVVVIGGGQAGLAAGYFLRRSGLSFAILDAGEAPGGAWRHAWDSLTLFSPAQWSSLPGWPMPVPADGGYPPRDAVIAYLAAYEARYALPVRRPVRVAAIRAAGDALQVSVGRHRLGRPRGDQRHRHLGASLHPRLSRAATASPAGRSIRRPIAGRRISPGCGCWWWAAAIPGRRSWPRCPASPPAPSG